LKRGLSVFQIGVFRKLFGFSHGGSSSQEVSAFRLSCRTAATSPLSAVDCFEVAPSRDQPASDHCLRDRMAALGDACGHSRDGHFNARELEEVSLTL
jgi:hypothetical protein